jgi:hypothetical protein
VVFFGLGLATENASTDERVWGCPADAAFEAG